MLYDFLVDALRGVLGVLVEHHVECVAEGEVFEPVLEFYLHLIHSLFSLQTGRAKLNDLFPLTVLYQILDGLGLCDFHKILGRFL